MTYIDMIKKVIKEYQGSDVIDNATKGKAIENFIMQYQETDWEFIKELPLTFKHLLFPFHLADKPKFTIGMPKGENRGNLNSISLSYFKRM